MPRRPSHNDYLKSLGIEDETVVLNDDELIAKAEGLRILYNAATAVHEGHRASYRKEQQRILLALAELGYSIREMVPIVGLSHSRIHQLIHGKP
jgi:hypothetical protein